MTATLYYSTSSGVGCTFDRVQIERRQQAIRKIQSFARRHPNVPRTDTRWRATCASCWSTDVSTVKGVVDILTHHGDHLHRVILEVVP